MGIFMSCCKPSASDNILTPDAETRRRQQVEAAEKRRTEAESRGVKDPEKVKRQQKKAEELDKREQEASKEGGPSLRWTSN